MSNFVNVPADLSCKLFDTLIRPILLYNSEVCVVFLSVFVPCFVPNVASVSVLPILGCPVSFP